MYNKKVINSTLIFFGKTISKISKSLNRGNGSTWPGHIALKGNPTFIKDILSNSQIKTIIVAGTNGKTTTTSLIKNGLEKNGKTVIQNNSGANLLNGIASALLLNSNSNGKLTQDYAIFEVDENVLPLVLKQIEPDYLVLLNLFRDQLDRYGEINTIAEKWKDSISKLNQKTKLVLNADDPLVASIPVFLRVSEQRTYFFSLQEMNSGGQASSQAADSVSCPRCGNKLTFKNITFSHLGNWECKKCGLQRPKKLFSESPLYPLSGTYNKYNTNASVIVLRELGLNAQQIKNALKNFKPSFGRQEIITYKNRNVQLFLSKNPTSFNQSFETIKELPASTLLFILNDRIPDGRDISWIWDTDLMGIEKFKHIVIAGDRVYDMALRLKYELGIKEFAAKVQAFERLKDAIDESINTAKENETVFILPTYSAMLDARKILTGKKIL